MRLATVALCLCACVTADPGGLVGVTHVAPPGSFVVATCMEKLDGDEGGSGSPLYLVDSATGAVTRWEPDPLPPGADILSSAATPALFLDAMLKLWSLSPDGTVHQIGEHPTRDENRFGSDGAHRMQIVQKTVQWLTFDGKVERTFVLPDFPTHIFPAPSGERAVAQMRDATVLVDARGATKLLDNQGVVAASWSPDGQQVAFVTFPLANGAQPLDDRELLWRTKVDGSAPMRVALPERPRDFVWSVLGRPQQATAVKGVVWANEGLVIMSNHESECWWGGRDSYSGCYEALYRLPPEGGDPKRISPRAFRCQSLYQLQAPKR
jgi:hypothetical protein